HEHTRHSCRRYADAAWPLPLDSLSMATKAATKSGRYTAPKPKTDHHSPFWLPVIMATSFLTRLAVIVLNYLNLLPRTHPQNRYLFLGLAWVVFGFILAANYK